MIRSKIVLSVSLLASLFALVGCGGGAPASTSVDEEIFKVDAAQFRAAVSFSNTDYYRWHQDAGGYSIDTEVNNVREMTYSEQSEYAKYWWARDYGWTYLYDWQPSENIFFKYRTEESNDNDGFAINTVQYYTKGFEYADFEYREDKRAYYQERAEDSPGVGGAPARRVYFYFKYQKLIKAEFFVYMDSTDWQDRLINVDYSNPKDITMRGVQFIDKGDIGDNM